MIALKNFLKFIFHTLGFLNALLGSMFCVAIFAFGTFEAGGFMLYYLILGSIPLGILYLFIFYLIKKLTAYQPSNFANILYKSNMYLLLISVVVVLIAFSTDFFYNLHR